MWALGRFVRLRNKMTAGSGFSLPGVVGKISARTRMHRRRAFPLAKRDYDCFKKGQRASGKRRRVGKCLGFVSLTRGPAW